MKATDTGLFTILNTDAGTAMGTITGSLKNLGITGVYRMVAPQTAALPYVVFSEQSGISEWQFDQRYAKSLLYLVKAVGSGHSGSAASAASDRFDVLLNDQPLTLTGWTCVRLRREQDVEYVEESEGVIYQHVGGLYRLDVIP